MKVLGIDNVFLPVGDLTEAVAFYENTVGLPVAKRFDQIGWAFELRDPWGNVIGFTDYTLKPALGR